jgi:2',3'-cyclic-nucleotide 2'-phosphodiesterase (5'-nucleotidase family)
LAAFLLAACSISTPLPTSNSQSSRELTILYTNDEHGWIEGVEEGQGAANLVGLWQVQEGYHQDGPFLLLSGGDNWTGPAISTWFEGRGTVEVMNEMGYAASVVGNHDFDFGLQALKDRLAEAKFPYLSANLRYKRDGTTPSDLGVLPFTIREIGGLRLGVIGLTTTSTPRTTNPANLTA